VDADLERCIADLRDSSAAVLVCVIHACRHRRHLPGKILPCRAGRLECRDAAVSEFSLDFPRDFRTDIPYH
jgi:hypothetical protein